MLIKTIFLWYEYNVQPEAWVYQWDTYYVDVTWIDRFAQYVAKAYELNLLKSLSTLDANNQERFSPYKSMTKEEIIELVDRVDIGQEMDEELMRSYLWSSTYPTRDKVADLLVRKFGEKFVPYFYFQWANRVYLELLQSELKWRHYEEQYMIIMDQLTRLEQNDPKILSVLKSISHKPYSTYWIAEYLKTLVKQ